MIAGYAGIGAGIRRPDPNVVLHLRFDGESNSFVDLTGKTVSYNSGATQTTSPRKFLGKSVVLDGTDDYLYLSDNAAWNLGTYATVEAWVYLTGSTARNTVISQGSSGKEMFFIANCDTNTMRMAVNNGSYIIDAQCSYTWSLSQWYHLAYVKNNTTQYLFVNGQSQTLTTNTCTSWYDFTSSLYIGRDYAGSANYFLKGNIDELIITNRAKWTANFTPPTRRK